MAVPAPRDLLSKYAIVLLSSGRPVDAATTGTSTYVAPPHF